jgi:hypothetical protein
MALDFPASPTNGQKYPASPVAGIPTYTWDGQKWTTIGAGLIGQYVAKSGDTMTGALTLDIAKPLVFNKTATSGAASAITSLTNGATRWTMVLGDPTAESGGNAGSDFILYNSNDAGSTIGAVLSIKRATGAINIKQTTATVLNSGSGTYTSPVGCVRLKVRMVGGGGGGAGGGNATPIGGTAGSTLFGSWNAPGGAGNAPGNPASGGNSSGAYLALVGGNGCYPAEIVNGTGAIGGASPFGGAGVGVAFGNAGSNATGPGSGGGGGGSTSAGTPGQGGGSGAYIEGFMAPGSYAYAVGAGGAGGAAGAGGVNGGYGGNGIIIVEEFYI